MADDDEKAHDWDPDREKRQTDPEAIARSFVRAAAEEQKKIEEEARKERIARDMDRPAARVGPALSIPMDLQLAVHKITNGYVVVWALSPTGYPSDRANSQEAYAETPAAVVATVLRLTQEHLDGRLKPFGGPQAPGTAYGYPEPA